MKTNKILFIVIVILAIIAGYLLIGEYALGGLLAFAGLRPSESKRKADNDKIKADVYKDIAAQKMSEVKQAESAIKEIEQKEIEIIEEKNTTPLNQEIKEAREDWT